MSRYYSYLNSAVQIVQQYRGEEPLSSFVKKYFAQFKKFGSKDRKQVSHLCYCYFRLGKAALGVFPDERGLLGLFLCSSEPNELLTALRPDWNEQITLSTKEKLALLNNQFSIFDIFPWGKELSDGIVYEKFCESFFIQPDLYLRLRPGKENHVKQKLNNENIAFEPITNNCLALLNASKLDQVIELDKEAVIQDYNSQRIGEFLDPVRQEFPAEIVSVWDCCAASGGKSIMTDDLLENIELTVSDVRESIINNLKKRFAKAGIRNYNYFVKDLARETIKTNPATSGESFDLIIADVPCSGSGTWARTPEQLFYFEESEIDRYSSLQKRIIANIIPHLKHGGYILYATCSVFRKENEDAVNDMVEKFHLEVKRMEVLKGYDKKADTMFAALLQKKL